MKFPTIRHKLTGVVVPVFSLRSSKSCGIGEFSDLPLLGKWCVKSGIELIQILPVNDTGYQESPYSALSAFALHPIFIRLDEVKESQKYHKEIQALRDKFENKKRVQFAPVLTEKLKILWKIYTENSEKIKNDEKLNEWLKENPWVINYAIFSTIRNKNALSAWKEWDKYSNPTKTDLSLLWKKFSTENFFYLWVQYNLEKQLKDAVDQLNSMGVSLKGDIPILMNEDSCDVWSERDFFNLDLTAGAPPDMFSSDGQNWGFPIYNWDKLKIENYSWWRNRLKQAEKFYHAYRIDHVLGFFRIWNIPENMISGSMGYFNPSSFINIQDLQNIGFDDGRINWLSKAHIFETELRDNTGVEADSIIDIYLDRIGTENIYILKKEFNSEKTIRKSSLEDHSKKFLIKQLKNRTLIPVNESEYTLSWSYRETRGYNSLNQWEKDRIEEISSQCAGRSEKIWEENARNLLTFMKDTTDMLVCAEDLGAVPDSVPFVLQSLGILGLKVLRWAREWNEQGEPYTPVTDYPLLSVCTPAVHDSSTLRQWWYEENDKTALSRGLGIDFLGEEPTESSIKTFIEFLLKSSSALCMLQIQDLFALDNSVCDSDINFERINIPGTVQDVNWSYRINEELEVLLANTKLTDQIHKLTTQRRSEKISL